MRKIKWGVLGTVCWSVSVIDKLHERQQNGGSQ